MGKSNENKRFAIEFKRKKWYITMRGLRHFYGLTTGSKFNRLERLLLEEEKLRRK